MSECDANGYDIEQKRKARQTMAKAVTEFADSHEVTSGGICTGYVTVMEVTTADGKVCFWLTGSGGTPEDDHSEGLESWRVEGLLRYAIRDINWNNTSDS